MSISESSNAKKCFKLWIFTRVGLFSLQYSDVIQSNHKKFEWRTKALN